MRSFRQFPTREAFSVLWHVHIVERPLGFLIFVSSAATFKTLRISILVNIVLIVELWLRIARNAFVTHLGDKCHVHHNVTSCRIKVGIVLIYVSLGLISTRVSNRHILNNVLSR